MIDTTASGSPPAAATATVGFVDLAGFSAIADVHGDAAAITILERFETMVADALGERQAPVKWIGDEAMLAFPDPDTALRVLGGLLRACRAEPLLPLTRSGLNHGPVIRRGGDLFGTTVNVAARIAALAGPGELLATGPVAEVATSWALRCGRSARRRCARSPGRRRCSRSSWRRSPIRPGSTRCARCTPPTLPSPRSNRPGRGSARRGARTPTGGRRRHTGRPRGGRPRRAPGYRRPPSARTRRRT